MTEISIHRDFDNLPSMLTVAEAADVLRVSLNQMYYLIDKDNTIPVLNLGRKKLIPRDELKEWIKKNCYR
ncbi:MAG: helix-turn-helix domain-containing protein [Eubacterium sp.]|nr:helix-turn-helix domain-containing protein [Eubacterium sp.]